LKQKGCHGFITPVTWIKIPSAQSLRRFILNNFAIKEIIWLPELVFRDAQVNTLISIITKEKSSIINVKIYQDLPITSSDYTTRQYEQKDFITEDYSINIFEELFDRKIIRKITDRSQLLEKIAKPCSGYNPYEIGKGEKPGGGFHDKNTVKEKPYHSSYQLSSDWKPEIIGRNISRYFVNISGNRWIKYGPWLAAPRDLSNFQGERILIQEITGGKSRRIIACYYDKELYYSRDVIPVKIERNKYSGLYILGIINSKLITWYHHKRNPKAQKGLFPKILVSDIKNLPICKIDFNDPKDKYRHNHMVSLVETMLALHKRLPEVKTPREKETIQRQIDATDAQIDKLVYELYGLTEEEIRVVEGKNV